MNIRSAVIAMLLLVTIRATAQTTNTLSDAEIQGRQLVQKILAQWPAENFTNTGTLRIRHPDGTRTNISVKCIIRVEPTNWTSVYTATGPWMEMFSVCHSSELPNVYNHVLYYEVSDKYTVSGSAIGMPKLETTPFANSDFWLGDLGLEFFHWPQQKVLKREVHSSRGCTVLESTNPDPSTNGYSRVMSWIDTETLGIVEAYAYDTKGKQLKIFTPKDFKKVNGQWQVQTFLMENVQTGSRSRLEFDLKK
jgi:hypothetical protein